MFATRCCPGSVTQFTYKNPQRRLNRAAMSGDSFHAAIGKTSSMVKLIVLLIVLFSAGTFLAHAIEAYRDGHLRRFK